MSNESGHSTARRHPSMPWIDSGGADGDGPAEFDGDECSSGVVAQSPGAAKRKFFFWRKGAALTPCVILETVRA
jgi:hypothetical protein